MSSAHKQAFRRVFVPIDFPRQLPAGHGGGTELPISDNATVHVSNASIRALELARDLTGTHGELRLVHATAPLDPSSIYTGHGVGALRGAIEEIHRDAQETALQLLRALAERTCPGAHVSCSATHGVPVMFVLDEAERFDADLIIVPASDRGRVARFLLGSTADRVIREAKCPVLVVPSDATPRQAPQRAAGTSPNT
ncbi:MAG: universal stress protein [Nannocystaceae bacterium]